jgi:hypothetical protein
MSKDTITRGLPVYKLSVLLCNDHIFKFWQSPQKEHPAMFVFISISNFGEENIDINEDDHLDFY